ncbi:MAG: TssN family type VI secretion system protein [Janthinobacterium lividum]
MLRGIPTLGFFLEYLLLPILALLWAVGLVVINRKKGLLSNKQLLLLVLIFGLPMALAGLVGRIYLIFMPWYYLVLQAGFLGLGIFYVRELDHLLREDRHRQPLFGHLLTGVIMLLGGYLFSLLFNFFSSLHYGLWAATCVLPFYLPLLFVQAFEALVVIPSEIRKIWHYPRHAAEVVLDDVDPYRLMILAVELQKSPGSGEPPVKVKARTPADLPFGVWFQKFIDDYNYKFPNEPIQTMNASEEEYGWLFYYVKPSLFGLRRYIDADQSIANNKLTERCLIVAKRVEGH